MDNLLDNSFRVLFFVGAMVAIYGAYWLGRSGDPASAGVIAVAGILLCVFVYLHRFKRFEGLGFKGELWEREMEQAAELRRGLTDLAEQLGESVVWQMAPRRRPHEGRPFQEKLAIVERTTDILTGIGVTPQRIDELKTPWHKFVMFDLARPIVARFTSKISRRIHSTHDALVAEREQRISEDPANEENTAREVALEAEMHSMQELALHAPQVARPVTMSR